jgi:DNA/RNA endonuclease YhcR with UshA esterase domain
LAPDAARVGDLQQYEGKKVIVTGIITLYRGAPEIVVRKPEALKEDR